MRESVCIGYTVFLTSVTSLNGVGVIRHWLPGRFISHLQPVSEMHRHRQQPTKRSPTTALANDYRARATDHDIAVPASAVEHRSIQAVDENGAGNRSGDRLPHADLSVMRAAARPSKNTSGEPETIGLVP